MERFKEAVLALALTLWALIGTGRNAFIVLGVWALAFMIGKALPRGMRKGYRDRVVIILYLAACSAAVWLSGTRPGLAAGQAELAPGTGIDGEEAGYRILLGFILALFCWAFPLVLMWAIDRYGPDKLGKAIRKAMH